MDGTNRNTGAEGLLGILCCGLERSAEQRTAIQLGDRSRYVGLSDIAKMPDCPRAALAAKLFTPEYRSTDELSSDMACLLCFSLKSKSCTETSPSRHIWISRW